MTVPFHASADCSSARLAFGLGLLLGVSACILGALLYFFSVGQERRR